MFELKVIGNTPLSGIDDPRTVAETFFIQIGYLPANFTPRNGATTVRESIPYRLMMDYFLKLPSKIWTAEELAVLLDTTKPTVYRYIGKLKSMDLLETADTKYDGQIRKGYRIRFGDLSKAWSFTEANVSMAMENYKKSISHLQQLILAAEND